MPSKRHGCRLLALREPGTGRRMTELPIHALITTPPEGEAWLAAGDRSIRRFTASHHDCVRRISDCGPA